MSEKTIIELKNVTKVFYLNNILPIKVLDNVSLKFKEGHYYSIIGPSGAGKSTLLSIIGCLDYPTSGKVFIEGTDVTKLSEDELANIRGKKIGFVFQLFNLISVLTAYENVELPMIFAGVDEEERKRRVNELLDMVGLSNRKNHRPLEMSGGEQQRVAIARALALNPKIIVADEPTGNLDSKTGEKIMNIIDNLHKNEGKTIILVTHDIKVAKHAEFLIRIRDGKIEGIEENK